jgi:hypothetical protein
LHRNNTCIFFSKSRNFSTAQLNIDQSSPGAVSALMLPRLPHSASPSFADPSGMGSQSGRLVAMSTGTVVIGWSAMAAEFGPALKASRG